MDKFWTPWIELLRFLANIIFSYQVWQSNYNSNGENMVSNRQVYEKIRAEPKTMEQFWNYIGEASWFHLLLISFSASLCCLIQRMFFTFRHGEHSINALVLNFIGRMRRFCQNYFYPQLLYAFGDMIFLYQWWQNILKKQGPRFFWRDLFFTGYYWYDLFATLYMCFSIQSWFSKQQRIVQFVFKPKQEPKLFPYDQLLLEVNSQIEIDKVDLRKELNEVAGMQKGLIEESSLRQKLIELKDCILFCLYGTKVGIESTSRSLLGLIVLQTDVMSISLMQPNSLVQEDGKTYPTIYSQVFKPNSKEIADFQAKFDLNHYRYQYINRVLVNKNTLHPTLEFVVPEIMETLKSLNRLHMSHYTGQILEFLIRLHKPKAGLYVKRMRIWLSCIPWSIFGKCVMHSIGGPWLVLGAALGLLQLDYTWSKQSAVIIHLETAYELIKMEAYQQYPSIETPVKIKIVNQLYPGQFAQEEPVPYYLLKACLRLLIIAYRFANVPTKAIEFALEYLNTSPNLEEQIFLYEALAEEYAAAKELSKAAEVAKKLLGLLNAQQIDDLSPLHKIFQFVGTQDVPTLPPKEVCFKVIRINIARFLPPEKAVEELECALDLNEGSEEELIKEIPKLWKGAQCNSTWVKGMSYTLIIYCALNHLRKAGKLIQRFDPIIYAMRLDNTDRDTWIQWQEGKKQFFTLIGDVDNASKCVENTLGWDEEGEGTIEKAMRLLTMAQILIAQGLWNDALEELNNWESSFGMNSEAMNIMPLPWNTTCSIESLILDMYNNRGFCYFCIGKCEEALRDLTKAMEKVDKYYGCDPIHWTRNIKYSIASNNMLQARCLIQIGQVFKAQDQFNKASSLLGQNSFMDMRRTETIELELLMCEKKYDEAAAEGHKHFLKWADYQSALGQGMKAEWLSILNGTDMRPILKMIECSSGKDYIEPMLWAERSHMRLFMFEKGVIDFNSFDESNEYAKRIIVKAVARCDPKTAIIFYSYDSFYDRSHLHMYMVANVDGSTMVVFPVKVVHSDTIKGLENLVSDARSAITSKANSKPHLGQLYKILFERIEEEILPYGIDTLLFVPQEELCKVPFAALYNSQDGKYLVEKYCIGVIPGFRALYCCFHQQLLFQKHFANLMKPFVAGNPHPMGRSEKNLAKAAEEAEAVAKLLGVEPVVGKAMTKAAVVEGLQTASLVLIATHGNLGTDDVSEGTLIMQESTHISDEVLTGFEISQLEIKAGLVILSACLTGDGMVTKDGLLSLGRAVLAAGAPSAIVTLWKVGDFITKEIILEMMREFVKGEKPVIKCLQKVMKDMIDANKRVYEWAPLSLIGSPTLRWPLQEAAKVWDSNIDE